MNNFTDSLNDATVQQLLPRLSVVVPVLNEATELPGLFDTLSSQIGVAFELILADGGSNDDTIAVAKGLGKAVSFPVCVIISGKGRGRQLNAGAVKSRGDFLLFLHVDSRFEDPSALASAVDALVRMCEMLTHDRVAGHFALKFRRHGQGPSKSYFFYEFKARLSRSQCIHGDQGFLMSRNFFQHIGPYDETFTLMEDTRLAEKIFRDGQWVLLPAEIGTSARRFESEGLFPRQVLNAFIMNFAFIDFMPFFQESPAIYRLQDKTSRLQLLPYFQLIHYLVGRMPWQDRLALWYRTGIYVRSHAWQIALLLDVRKAFRRNEELTFHNATPILDGFDSIFDTLSDNPVGYFITSVLVVLWFYSFYGVLLIRRQP